MPNLMRYRSLHPGIGQAVAERTILRKKSDGSWETWGDVADRVSLGNTLLGPENEREVERHLLRKHIANATVLMSGRHLQHGDASQPERNLEVYTNCATAASSFLLFYLLLNGSGVGRCYDDDMIVVNWDNAPVVRCVLDEKHPDYDVSAHESARDARHKYGKSKDVLWFEVPDNREGWAKALEILENAAFEKIHRDKMLILDFSKVREKGQPIGGMQGRPASGPVPLMNAFQKANTLKGAGLAPWKQAMYIDHYFAECVLVGGARRAARMATKSWRDKTILDFIQVKRPIEFYGKSVSEVLEYRKNTPGLTGFLWSSNNSVTTDEEFWVRAALKSNQDGYNDPLSEHARRVLKTITQCSYGDGTGEPGIINVHKLVQKDDGLNDHSRGDYIGSRKYQINEDTHVLMARLASRARKKKYHMIVNPCGEIVLLLLGAFCVIADVVPYHADTLEEAEEAFRVATRALIRVNTMPSIYEKEVRRTNRIGVGITGVHEFAWKFFRLGFRDLIDESKSKDFWAAIARFKRAVREEAETYSKKLGVTVPHTNTTIKPAGCMGMKTSIRTKNGTKTLLEIFQENGVDVSSLSFEQQWFDLKDELIVYDANNQEQRVTKLFYNGQMPTIDIEMEDGAVVQVTCAHQFLTTRGWVRADELLESDDILQY